MKTFKQFLAENTIKLIDGIIIDSESKRLLATREGYNWLINNLGLLFTEKEKPKNKSNDEANTYDYFSIDVETIINKLLEEQSLFVKNDETIKCSFYRLIEPKTRKYVQQIFDSVGYDYIVEMNDKRLLKYFTPKELYLYPR